MSEPLLTEDGKQLEPPKPPTIYDSICDVLRAKGLVIDAPPPLPRKPEGMSQIEYEDILVQNGIFIPNTAVRHPTLEEAEQELTQLEAALGERFSM